MRYIVLVVLFLFSCAQKPTRDLDQFGSYTIDSEHSTIMFRVSHMGVSYIYGRFPDIQGKINFYEEYYDDSSVELVLGAASVTTAHQKRDDQLRGPSFFNVSEHPQILFKSRRFKALNEDAYLVKGDLTIHGTTKKVEVKLNKIGGKKDQSGHYRLGFEGGFSLKRSDYGLTHAMDRAGDEVELLINIEAIKVADKKS